MEISQFTELMEDIVSTRSTNHKEDVIASVLEDNKAAIEAGDPVVIDNIETFLRIASGEEFKDPERTLNFKKRRMRSVVVDALAVTEDEFSQIESDVGKVSEAVEVAWDKHKGDGQVSLGEFAQNTSDRELADIWSVIDQMPEADSDTERESLVRGLLEDCESGTEAKWVSFCVLSDISTYMSWKTAAKAFCRVFDLDKDEVYRARALTWGDFPTVFREYAEGDGLRQQPEVFVPFKPMLAKDRDMSEIEDNFVAQPKFDGARMLIHSDGDEIRLYTRGLKDVTESFPEITENIEPMFPFIADGEVVAYDQDDNVLPFEKVMNRVGRTEDVDEKRQEIPCKVWLFDCVRTPEGPICDEPLEERADLLDDLVAHVVPGSTSDEWEDERYRGNDHVRTTPTYSDIAFAYEMSTVDHEGIIAKDLTSPYVFDRDKAFTKVKPEITLDVRVTSYQEGTGQYAHSDRANDLGALALESEDGHEIGQVGTGFSDEFRQAWSADRADEIVGRIIEVTVDSIQVTGDGQLGTRFARFERFRDDEKGAADSIERILDMAGDSDYDEWKELTATAASD